MSRLGRYYVWSPHTGRTTVPHNTRGEAETEACRLVDQHPKHSFYVLHAVSVAYTHKPILVTRVEEPAISVNIEQTRYADGDI